MLEKIIYTGIGAGAMLKEKITEELTKLEEKGRIHQEDAKTLIESVEQKGKEVDENLRTQIKDILKEVIEELGIATKEDIVKLKEELK
jgi:polyhydroxyalkanoate synthesis regulator phasin